MRHKYLASAAIASACLAATLAAAAPAQAHESLVSSSPAEGEKFETAPAAIELEFTDEVLPLGAAIVVVDEVGTDWATGDINVSGATVTAALEPDMPEAGYQLRWRVVSGDGHPISSVIPFTVGDAEPYTATPREEPSPTPTSADAQTDDPSDSGGALWILAYAGAGAVVAGGAYIAITTYIRRRNAASPQQQEQK